MVEGTTTVDASLGTGRDFDVRPDGSWVGVFERGDGLHVAHTHGPGFRVSQALRYPMVRAIGYDRIVLVEARPLPNTSGGTVLSLDGQVHREFSIGDGVQDVVVLEDLIAITYFDEGVFSGRPPSEQGIAFFDFDGEFFGGYQSLFGAAAVDIADCYAACRAGRSTLAFSAYTGFELVRVRPRTREQELVPLPPELHGASALSVVGDRCYFFSPYDRKGSLLAWRPDAAAREIGCHSGLLRGIESGRFLSTGAHGFTVLSPDIPG